MCCYLFSCVVYLGQTYDKYLYLRIQKNRALCQAIKHTKKQNVICEKRLKYAKILTKMRKTAQTKIENEKKNGAEKIKKTLNC